MIGRRQLGLGLLGLGALALVGTNGQKAAGSLLRGFQRQSTAPRYCVILFLRGGMDAIFTTDPKERSEVDSSIDVPYPSSEILSAGNVRLGPHLKALEPFARKLAIVNGVHVGTANHETGAEQMLRLRTQVTPAMPGILDIVGAHREGQALGCLTLGNTYHHDHSGGWFGNEALLREIDRAGPEDLAMMARTYRREASNMLSHTKDAERAQAADNLTQCAALFERLVTTPKFMAAAPPGRDSAEVKGSDESVNRNLERCLWALENDLTRCAYVKFADWDTHSFNARAQKSSSTHFFPLLANFLKALETRRNAYGSLAENTLVIVGSELGRFPRLNNDLGKDHFPQAPYLFFGPGIQTNDGRGAAFGKTAKQMEALPVDLRTGSDVAVGGHFMTLDDVGATVLHAMGVSPKTHGYQGNVLDFLVPS
jgi:uncharacterized protein (DUF1501 family)